jgi:hypothetical protein
MRRLLSLWIFDWRKLLAYSHRWMGIAGCVLFVAWFISGVVMMYARMPGMAEEERLARAQALDLSNVKVSPADAADKNGITPGEVHVGMLQGRPVYRFGGREQTIVFADTGDEFAGTITREQAQEIARRYAPGHAGALRYAAYLTEPDQWTIQSRNRMPMHRFDLDDAEDTHLYVSEVTGDVVLRTTRAERFWGYLGPVFHWVYFTPLRKNGPLWTQFVIWSSLIGCVMCVTGIVWGLWRYSPRSSYRLKRHVVDLAVCGLDEVAPRLRVALWRGHAHLGLQRSPVDGALQLVPVAARQPRTSAMPRLVGRSRCSSCPSRACGQRTTPIAPSFKARRSSARCSSAESRTGPHTRRRRRNGRRCWMHSGLLPEIAAPDMDHRLRLGRPPRTRSDHDRSAAKR